MPFAMAHTGSCGGSSVSSPKFVSVDAPIGPQHLEALVVLDEA